LRCISIEDWFRQERKNSNGGSIVWKDLVKTFPLIGKWTAWKIQRQNKVRIGVDPWIGCRGNFKLSEELIRDLHLLGIYSLENATTNDGRTGWSQGLKLAGDLNLQGAKTEDWNHFVRSLNSSAIKLSEQDDLIK